MAMDIPSHIEDEINKKASSGRYLSPEEVLRRALDALEEVERAEAEIRSKVATGLDQLNRGEGIPAEDVFSELHRDSRLYSKG